MLDFLQADLRPGRPAPDHHREWRPPFKKLLSLEKEDEMSPARKKQLKLGLAAYGTGWDQDAWQLPDATTSGLTDPSVIADLAAIAERGKLDYLFAGSSLATEPLVLQRIFRWDSAVFAGYAAARTEHVGFLVSYNSSFEHPYLEVFAWSHCQLGVGRRSATMYIDEESGHRRRPGAALGHASTPTW